MKKLLLGLIATFMLSVSGHANVLTFNASETSIINELPQEVQINYSIGNKKVSISKNFEKQGLEMKSYLESELEKLNLLLSSTENTLLDCSVTIHVGTANNYVSVTVSGECSAVMREAKRIRNMLMATL